MLSPDKWVLVGSFAFLLVSAGHTIRQHDDDPATWSVKQWSIWREHQIQRILTPTFPAFDGKILSREQVIARSADAYKFLAPLLADPEFMGNPGRKRVLGNFIEFIRSQSPMAVFDENLTYAHSLGFNVADREYWNRTESELQFPPLLKSQGFLEAMRVPATYQRAVEMLEAHNAGLAKEKKWTILLYRSRFLQAVATTTYGRLLIVVPNEPAQDGGTVDRWIQFALETPESGKPNSDPLRSVSMVVIHRNYGGTGTTRGFLLDFLRDRDDKSGKFSVGPTMFEQKGPSKNCYDCHKSPALAIQPKVRYTFDKHGGLVVQPVATDSTVEDLNQRIANYGRCELGFMDEEAYGPPLGPVNRDRSERFIAEASQDASLSKDSYERIRNAMKCSSCHDRFAKLNYPVAVDSSVNYQVFERKIGIVQTYIENGWMPPNNTLSSAERHALWLCLSKEYFDPSTQSGVLFDWLRGGK